MMVWFGNGKNLNVCPHPSYRADFLAEYERQNTLSKFELDSMSWMLNHPGKEIPKSWFRPEEQNQHFGTCGDVWRTGVWMDGDTEIRWMLRRKCSWDRCLAKRRMQGEHPQHFCWTSHVMNLQCLSLYPIFCISTYDWIMISCNFFLVFFIYHGVIRVELIFNYFQSNYRARLTGSRSCRTKYHSIILSLRKRIHFTCRNSNVWLAINSISSQSCQMFLLNCFKIM